MKAFFLPNYFMNEFYLFLKCDIIQHQFYFFIFMNINLRNLVHIN